jgi:hypothetical protein
MEYCAGSYDGDFRHGEKSGQGCLVYPNGAKYVPPAAPIALVASDAPRYVGGFQNGKRHGQGTMTNSEVSAQSVGWLSRPHVAR